MSGLSELSSALREKSERRKVPLAEIVAYIVRRMHGKSGGVTILFEKGTPRSIKIETFENVSDLAGL